MSVLLTLCICVTILSACSAQVLNLTHPQQDSDGSSTTEFESMDEDNEFIESYDGTRYRQTPIAETVYKTMLGTARHLETDLTRCDCVDAAADAGLNTFEYAENGSCYGFQNQVPSDTARIVYTIDEENDATIVADEPKKVCEPEIKLVRSSKTWADAQEYCLANGFDGLLSFPDVESTLKTAIIIKERATTGVYFVGAKIISNQWTWIKSGRPVDPEKEFNTRHRCPKTPEENTCGVFNRVFDPPICNVKCEDKRHFICGKEVTLC